MANHMLFFCHMKFNTVLKSALHCPGDNAFNNILLQEDEYDDGRQYSHYHGRHRILPVRSVLAHECISCKCKCLRIRRAVDHKQRKQEVIPDPHDVDDDDGRRYRFQQREDYTEEQAEAGSPVDRGAFIDFQRNAFDEAVIDKYSQRSSEAPIQQTQSPSAFGQVQVLGSLQYGQHDRLERNEHRHDAEEVDHSAPSGFCPCKLISRNGRNEHDSQQADAGNNEIVQEQSWIIDELPHIGVVAEGQLLRQGNNVSHDLTEAFQRVDYGQEQRIQEQKR